MRLLTEHLVKDNPAPQVSIEARGVVSIGGAELTYQVNFGSDYVMLHFQSGDPSTLGLNGLTNEALLAIVLDRLDGFQQGSFPCQENANARFYVQEALTILKSRIEDRVKRGVEGKYVK